MQVESAIWARLWEMMTTVRPCLMASRLAVGSSRKMMGGFLRKSRAMAMRVPAPLLKRRPLLWYELLDAKIAPTKTSRCTITVKCKALNI